MIDRFIGDVLDNSYLEDIRVYLVIVMTDSGNWLFVPSATYKRLKEREVSDGGISWIWVNFIKS